ncbi:MAG TPA: hypothetical protein VK909_07800 [Anaerolineales bacterium]|jgi:hypothetical protein|nr:hypothetical protein [Anaerolineales bacterium]
MGSSQSTLMRAPIPTLLHVSLCALFRIDAIFQITYSVLLGTMCAAVEFAVADFHSMTNDLAAAVRAAGRHGMDGALKAVKRTTLAALNDLK